MKKIYIIDGYSFLYRGFYATSYTGLENILRSSKGVPTNAVYAFLSMAIKILEKLKDDEGIFVGLDYQGLNFRKAKYDFYKANRAKSPDEIHQQEPILRELLDALNIPFYEKETYEGDDICGALAKKMSKKGIKVEIYTSDHDYFQLIDGNISVNLVKKGLSDVINVNNENIVELFGFKSSQLIDFKALVGDKSDNLPGIKNLGEKTAIKLLSQYDSLDNIIKNIDSIKGKLRENIETYIKDAYTTKELATIYLDIDIPFDETNLVYGGYEFSKFNEFAIKYDFKNSLNKLGNVKKATVVLSADYIKCDDLPLLNTNKISIYYTHSANNYHNDKVGCLSIYDGKNIYLINNDGLKNKTNLINILKDEKVLKNTFDYKALYFLLKNEGIEIAGINIDFKIALYLIDTSLNYNEYQILKYFNINVNEPSLIEEENNISYALISKNFYLLENKIIEKLNEFNLTDVYKNIELKVMDSLIKIEEEGMPCDKITLDEIGNKFKLKMNEHKTKLESEIIKNNGTLININSPIQLKDYLSKINISVKNTSNEVLEPLRNIEFIDNLLNYRKYFKLVSTYVDPFYSYINSDGKIHCIFNQCLTSTGRLSSSEPNMQNISIRNEDTRVLRKCFFYPNNEYKIVSFDYSQIELRVLAVLANSQSMIDVFNHDKDIHSETAKLIFKTNEITDLQRRKAKATNFGIVYGISDFGLAKDLNITRYEAKEIISNFYTSFPEITEFLNNIILFAKENGYVKTIYNRRKYTPNINSANYQEREFAKRQAMNAPIQGSAADIIKLAMINVDKLIKSKNYKSKMILQVHDELVFKVCLDELDCFVKDIKECMESVEFPIKLKVSVGIGNNYLEAK